MYKKGLFIYYSATTLTPHDTRSLMLHIMMRDCKIDSRLADFCLEHYQGEVISHYLDFTYEDKKMAFVDYWNIIKNND